MSETGVCGHRAFNVDAEQRYSEWCQSCQKVLLALEPIIGEDRLMSWLERPHELMYGKSPLEMIRKGNLFLLWSVVHMSEVPELASR